MSTNELRFYENEYYMLSNFVAFSVQWDNKIWMTSEHAYQAAKFRDPAIQAAIQTSQSPYDAKRIAHENKIKIRHDWQDVKLSVMKEIIRAKLEQHPHIREKLLESENRRIVENSPVDSFW